VSAVSLGKKNSSNGRRLCANDDAFCTLERFRHPALAVYSCHCLSVYLFSFSLPISYWRRFYTVKCHCDVAASAAITRSPRIALRYMLWRLLRRTQHDRYLLLYDVDETDLWSAFGQCQILRFWWSLLSESEGLLSVCATAVSPMVWHYWSRITSCAIYFHWVVDRKDFKTG